MELPEELMTLILLKLPAESLVRFKCVQKSWHSLIKSPSFIRLHRSSIKKNDCFIVRRQRQQQNVLSFHSYETLEDLGSQINIPFSFVGDLELWGSCDGLVCLSNRFTHILICNPTIREFRSLFVPPSFRVDSIHRMQSVAFGFDPNTGQYTVVMIGETIPDIHFANSGDREARLYDFNTDSWRETAAAFPPGSFHYPRCAVSLNGVFYWCPWDNSNYVLTFHMSNEVTEFIPLPLPDSYVRIPHEKEICVSTKSQLSLLLYYSVDERFEIWVMTDYGAKEPWTKLFNISRPLPLFSIQPIVFWDDQRLLFINEEVQLVSCDLQHLQNLRYFPIHGDFEVFPYSQSLVSVNGIGRPII